MAAVCSKMQLESQSWTLRIRLGEIYNLLNACYQKIWLLLAEIVKKLFFKKIRVGFFFEGSNYLSMCFSKK